ncbi:hypothetical protein U9M48_007773 [Paspalum notatum var. saurae]|uniref:ZCF37 n=1 Tax=Paspalum notatum var. saurae TaxID=547442 RepID=A0AAQ3SN55_PASNO
MFFCECGTGSFKHVADEDPAEDLSCTGVSPKARRRHGGKVNPYAELGLDRFSAVLSDLQTRRDKILRRVGSNAAGLVFVRFVQSDGDWTPVVVKLPEVPSKGAAGPKKQRAAWTAGAAPLRPASPRRERVGIKKVATTSTDTKVKVPARRASFSWRRTTTLMRRPSWYWPSVIVLTLVSLAVFGRVFAICLTSVWWYVLPTLGSSSNSSCCSADAAGAGEDAHRAGLRMSMEKKKLVSPPPPPHAKKGSVVVSGVHDAVCSPTGHTKGKRG